MQGRRKPKRRNIRRIPRLLALPKQPYKHLKSNQINLEQKLARAEKVFELRDKGMGYRDIGKELGIDPGTAYNDAKLVAQMKYKGLIEKDEMVIFESNEKYDKIMHAWMPLLEPLLSGELAVGETKRDRQGKEYDITIPTFEAAKTATEMILKASSQREKLNGFHETVKEKKSQGEEFGDFAQKILETVSRLSRRPIQAEVITEAIHDAA